MKLSRLFKLLTCPMWESDFPLASCRWVARSSSIIQIDQNRYQKYDMSGSYSGSSEWPSEWAWERSDLPDALSRWVAGRREELRWITLHFSLVAVFSRQSVEEHHAPPTTYVGIRIKLILRGQNSSFFNLIAHWNRLLQRIGRFLSFSFILFQEQKKAKKYHEIWN